MKRKWDEEQLGQRIRGEVEHISWSDAQEQEGLRAIHRAIGERRTEMKFHGKKMMIAVAAALVAMGSITAIAAGTITGYYSGINHNDAIRSASELQEKGRKALGESLVIAEQLADGIGYQEGYVTEVQGRDDEQNVISSFPEISVFYGQDVNLSVNNGDHWNEEAMNHIVYDETWEGIRFIGTQDNYLFLPPDQKPSPEDEALEQDGELYISYGSSQVEREVFKNLSWEQGGLRYMLFTSGDKTLEELAEMAKAFYPAS